MKKINNIDIENSINKSIEELTPNVFDRISISILEKEKKEMSKKKSMGFKLNNIYKYALAICVVVVAIISYGYYNNNYKVDSRIAIDVNPSIELQVNKSNKVIKALGINEGGKSIIGNMNLKKVDLDVAINAITGSMITKGLLTGDDANILISVENDNIAKADKLRTIIVSDVEKVLQEQNVKTMVINQTINENETEKKETTVMANNYNISHGKAVFIANLIKKDLTLKAEELATMSLRDIAALIEDRKINISDIVDYDSDDSTYENVEDIIEDINETNIDNGNYISSSKAKTIALEHAKVNGINITYIKAELDAEGDIIKYEVEFKINSIEYDYDINAIDGTIITSHKEVDDDNDDDDDKPIPTSDNYIGATKAKQIATSHAKVSNAKFLKAVLDTEDGIKVYEVEFKFGTTEYEYTINAKSGKIIEFDSEIDTDDED